MREPTTSDAAPWWKGGVLYQVYPRSFQDTDGDGVGDLNGIARRLPYLADLGMDGVWMSPIYPSPMIDFGYDISDHTGIDPIFGTLADFERMVAEAHRLGLKVLLDFVPCHTSDQHPWFTDSRSGRDAEKRDWYIWRDPAPGGGPPNNWQSEFGGPAWTLDRTSGQYYYHAHLSEQPELNWRNPAVREAMLGVMRHWFERGVDGLRIDAVDQIGKDAALADNPPNPDWHEGRPSAERFLRTNQKNGPFVHEAIGEMRATADASGGRVLVGEVYAPFRDMARYHGTPERPGLDLPHNFHLIGAPWDTRAIARLIEDYEASLPEGAWPNWVLGNHDRTRVATRWGTGQARVAAMLHLTLRGTPTIYQGEELGMENVAIPLSRVQDPWERNDPGHGLGRDPVRTPIAWEDGGARAGSARDDGAGFTTGEPWLPIDARSAMTVAAQADDPHSMLSLYRDLIRLRRAEPALALGSYRTLHADDAVLAYERRLDGRRVAVALNFSGEPVALPVRGEVLLSTAGDDAAPPGRLAPLEGRIVVAAD